MKTLIATLFLSLLANVGFSQDVIELRNGEKIEGKIIEITTETIKYTRKDQPDGPIRNIAQKDVAMIVYADGSRERFVLVEEDYSTKEVPKQNEEAIEKRRETEREKRDKDRLLEPGMFIDLMAGYARFGTQTSYKNDFYGLSVKLGNKWYFGKNEKYRPGIQATWIRFGAYSTSLDPRDISKGYFSVLNLGFANVIKFKDNVGMEINLNVGPTILETPIGNNSGRFGLLYGLELKYRLGKLALGIDATRVEEQLGYGYGIGKGDALSLLSFSVGFKF